MKSSRVCWRPGPSGFSRNKYTPTNNETKPKILEAAPSPHVYMQKVDTR